jgi:exopolyphosphatase/pppGpp-phosphohydrolase
VIAVQVVMEALGVSEMMVSGEGLREGIAFSLNSFEAPAPEAVKQASIAGLAHRFRAWEPGRARQRLSAARQLAAAIDPDSPAEFHEILEQAAFVLDIGRSVDYYDRLSHTATIVLVADLDGFTHREIALLTAIIREADKRQSDFSQYDPLVTIEDVGPIARCGVILAIADEIERRYPGDTEIQLKLESDSDKVTMTIPPFSAYEIAKLGDRFRRAFGRELIFN